LAFRSQQPGPHMPFSFPSSTTVLCPVLFFLETLRTSLYTYACWCFSSAPSTDCLPLWWLLVTDGLGTISYALCPYARSCHSTLSLILIIRHGLGSRGYTRWNSGDVHCPGIYSRCWHRCIPSFIHSFGPDKGDWI